MQVQKEFNRTRVTATRGGDWGTFDMWGIWAVFSIIRREIYRAVTSLTRGLLPFSRPA